MLAASAFTALSPAKLPCAPSLKAEPFGKILEKKP
jgi:hypothetical protein